MKKILIPFLLLVFSKSGWSIDLTYDRIVYLSDSTLYIYDLKTHANTRISPKDDKVSEFMVSPDDHYLAYVRRFGYTTCAGGFVEENDSVPTMFDEPVYSIKIVDLRKNELLKEIVPRSSEFLSLLNWISSRELLINSNDCESFNARLKFDVTNSQTIDCSDEDLERYRSVIGVTRDGDYLFFTDRSGALHKYNFFSKTDLVLPASNNPILDCEQSYNKKFMAWLEVDKEPKKDKAPGSVSYIRPINTIILFSVLEWKKTDVYSEEATKNGSRKCLAFSPKDSIISIETDKKILIRNIYTKESFYIYGQNMGWLDANSFIYARNNCIFRYDIRLKQSTIIITNAYQPYPVK